MAKLTLSVAVGDYDRTRPLIDGAVRIDGVEPTIMTLTPEEIFFRAFRDAPFDICELSLSSFTLKTALGDCPYVGVPPSCRAPSATPRSTCARTASSGHRTSRAARSVSPNISSRPVCGRARCWPSRASRRPMSRGCAAGWRKRAGWRRSR